MGKIKKQTIGYKYLMGMHHILCHGPVDNVSRVTVGERLAWEGVTTGGQIVIDSPELFGGEQREGGVSGIVDIEMGGPTQTANDYLVSQLGADVPGYRGVVGAVLRQCYVGNNPYIKSWSYRATRTDVRQDGIEQWYVEKAAIDANNQGGVLSGTVVLNWMQCTAVQGSGANPDLGRAGIGFLDAAGVEALGADPDPGTIGMSALQMEPTTWSSWAGPSVWTARSLSVAVPAGAVAIVVHIAGDAAGVGSGNVAGFDSIEATLNGVKLAITNPGAELGTISGWKRIDTGLVVATEPLTPFEGDYYFDGGASNTYHYYQKMGFTGFLDMNPAHVIRECLTDPDWGMGYPDTDVDDVTFTAAADTLFSEGLGISLLWASQETIENFVGEVIKHIDASLYVSRTTGKFELKLIRGDYDVGDLLTLDESNIIKVSNPNEPTLRDLVNSVSVKFWDQVTGKMAAVTVDDPALVQMQGKVISTSATYQGITNANNATRLAQRDLRSLSSPLFSCTIYANRDAKDLNIGDVFLFTWSRWKKNALPMRVTGIAFGDGKSSQIRISCIQDVFSTPATPVIAHAGDAWVDPVSLATPCEFRAAFETPYYEMMQFTGPAELDAALETNPDIGYVTGAAAHPASGYTGRLWTDAGAGSVENSPLDFAPHCTLVSAISPAETVFEVENIKAFDLIEVGTVCLIGNDGAGELCRVDAVDENAGTVTLGRGCLDTTPNSHAAGTPVFFWDAYSGQDKTEYLAGETVTLRITPISGLGQLPLGLADPDDVTLDSRAIRPYPPGNLLIDGESYPEELITETTFTLDWAHRDRLQQTSSEVFDHTFGPIGPELDTTYEVRAYIDGLLDVEHTGLTDPTDDVSPVATGDMVVEVHSKRGDYLSWQPARYSFVAVGSSETGAGLLATEEGEFILTEEGSVLMTED